MNFVVCLDHLLNEIVNHLFVAEEADLRKNSWSSETYKFDEVLTDSASQKRVYEVVAKPVVEVNLSKYDFKLLKHI